jgi:hypothetical protein
LADATNANVRESEGRVQVQKSLRGSPADSAAPRAAAKSAAPAAGNGYVNVEMFASANDASYAAPPIDLPPAPAPRLGIQSQNTFSQNSFSLSNAAPLTAMPAPYEMPSGKPLRMITPNPNSTHLFGWSAIVTIGNNVNKKLLRSRAAPPIMGFASNTMGQPGQFNPAKQPGPSDELSSAFSVNGNRKDSGGLAGSRAFTSLAMSHSEQSGSLEVDGTAPADIGAAGSQLGWKVAGGKLLKLNESGSWTEPYSGEGIAFSVVTPHGSDVWAGGSNAAVIHSRDGGASWERITLGAAATGTIHGIEASGLKIVVRSSSGQSWSSADGGKSWSLEN